MNKTRFAGAAWLGLMVALVVLPVRHGRVVAAEPVELVVTNDLTFEAGGERSLRLIIRASHVTVNGRGATLVGPGRSGDPASLAAAGIGVRIEGACNVTVRGLKARGFATGLLARECEALRLSDCDFSDNYHNPKHGWGELPPAGGVRFESVRNSVVGACRAHRVWDGLSLVDSDDNLVLDNDFSECSNTCAKLWKSCRNRFLRNNLSRGIRIDRAAGEVHARDSTGVLIETGSDDNYWFGNDVTHGGDGLFIRPLNRWVSQGNVFVENDFSYANNNCVESWGPGNTFIRNRANHGSYGFWLGGSDRTVLIGNEAAFNGRPDGYHNAPEPGFGHGGIVIVGGPATHTRIEGNHLHHNHGAGLAFRGDTATQGVAWRTEHWVVQQNRIVSNRFGLWGRWGDRIVLAGNTVAENTSSNVLDAVARLVELPLDPAVGRAPLAALRGSDRAVVGQPIRFDAADSRDPQGRPLRFLWDLDGSSTDGLAFERVFDAPGFHRLHLTVHNGALAAIAWRDLLVVPAHLSECGTEGDAAAWGFDMENNAAGRGRVRFDPDPDALVGSLSLRCTVDPYTGAYATFVYPAARNAGWNLASKTRVRFWLKSRNPNLPGWQNAGPVLRLLGPQGWIEYRPAKDANALNDPPYSEARWLWSAFEIPLAGNARWTRTPPGNGPPERADALSLGVDSWGGDPFVVWLDGLAFE
jgi:parallel beta-helix repeat protein